MVAHGQACWEAPSSSSSGMDVLDEEVAGLQMDIEWTEGMEQRVRELLDRSTLEASHFPDTRHGSSIEPNPSAGDHGVPAGEQRQRTTSAPFTRSRATSSSG